MGDYMANKIFYCVDFRNMHTAIHGLVIFKDKRIAEIEYTKLSTAIIGIDGLYRHENINSEQYNKLYSEILDSFFKNSILVIEEVNFREFTEIVRYGKMYKKYQVNDKIYLIINSLSAIDLYC